VHPIVDFFAEPKWPSTTAYNQLWYLRFRLEVTEANKAIWTDLLKGKGLKARRVTVTLGESNVGDQDTYEMPTDLLPNSLVKENRVVLQIASLFPMTAGIVVVALLLVMFLLLATTTGSTTLNRAHVTPATSDD